MFVVVIFGISQRIGVPISYDKNVLFCKNEEPFTRFPKPIENICILTLIQY